MHCPNDTAEVLVATKPMLKDRQRLSKPGSGTRGTSPARALPPDITIGHILHWPPQCSAWGPLAGRVPTPSTFGNLGNATPTSVPTCTESRVARTTLDPTRSREELRPVALWLGARALGQAGRGPQVALPLTVYRTLEHQVTSLGRGSSSEGKRESRCHFPGTEKNMTCVTTLKLASGP